MSVGAGCVFPIRDTTRIVWGDSGVSAAAPERRETPRLTGQHLCSPGHMRSHLCLHKTERVGVSAGLCDVGHCGCTCGSRAERPSRTQRLCHSGILGSCSNAISLASAKTQGARVRVPGCLSGHEDSRVSGCQDTRAPGYQGARAPGCQGVRAPGCQGARASGCQGARAPGCQGIR